MSFALALCFLVPLSSRANPETDFDAANKLYEQGKYAQAAAAYEALGRTNHAASVLFNLGNAYLKSGQVGRAIAAYRRAQKAEPRDPDVRANLRFARSQVQGANLPAGRVSQWLGQFTLNEWTLFTAALIWLLFLLLALIQWRPTLRGALRFYVVALAAGALLSAVCLGLAWHDQHAVQTAIVLAPETQARQGPFDESPIAFTVGDGAELRVLDQKDQWLQVIDGRRRIGWLRQENALLSAGESRS